MRPWAQSSTLANLLASARENLRPGSLEFACHAAVPVALDPGFVHLLRVNFFLDPPLALPYEAEAEFLLSPLVRELGEGLYEVEPELRSVLLEGLVARFGSARLARVAVLLEQYTERTPAWQTQPELEHAQLLTALTLVDPAKAASWLDDAATLGGASVELGREWFVAMRDRLHDTAPSGTQLRQTEHELARLSNPDTALRTAAVHRLGELALLPGSDVLRISHALLAESRSESDCGRAAASVLDAIVRLVPPPQSVVPDVADTSEYAELPLLTDLLGIDDPAGYTRRPRLAADLQILLGRNAANGPVNATLDNGLLLTGPDAGRHESLRSMLFGIALTEDPRRVNLLLVDLSRQNVFAGMGLLPHVTDAVRIAGTDIHTQERLAARLAREIAKRQGQSERGQGSPDILVVVVERIDQLKAGLLGPILEQIADNALNYGMRVLATAQEAPATSSFALRRTLEVTDQPHKWHIRLSEWTSTMIPTVSRPHKSISDLGTHGWDLLLERSPRPTLADVLIQRMANEPKAKALLLPPLTERPTLHDVLDSGSTGVGRWTAPIGFVVRSVETMRKPLTVDLNLGVSIIDSSGSAEADELLQSIVLSLAKTRLAGPLRMVFIRSEASQLHLLTQLPNVQSLMLPYGAKVSTSVRNYIRTLGDPTDRQNTLYVLDGLDMLPETFTYLYDCVDVLGSGLLTASRTDFPRTGHTLTFEAPGRWVTHDGVLFAPARPVLQQGEELSSSIKHLAAELTANAVTRQARVPVIPGLTELSLVAIANFAIVFRATQPAVGRQVIVKIVTITLDSDEEKARFLREARKTGRMSSHPHVLGLYDAGVTPDNNPYLVMELAEASYSDLMPLRPDVVRSIAVKMASALIDAHTLGVLHGNIRPSNILLSTFGEPSLADFRIPILAEVKHPRDVFGSTGYEPPEAFRRAEPAPPADIYSLCATLYAMLSGSPPRWKLGQPTGVLSAIELFAEPIPDIPGVPSSLVDVLRSGMYNDISLRPTAVQLAQMLQEVDLSNQDAPELPYKPEPLAGNGITGFLKNLFGRDGRRQA